MSSSRALAAVVLFFVAVAGGLTALAVDRFVRDHDEQGFPPSGLRVGLLRERERGFRHHFARELGLDTAQEARVDSLMDRQLREIRAVRDQVRPRLDSIIAQTRQEIDAILTPEQRQKAAALAKERRGFLFRGPGGPAGGPLGGGLFGPPPGEDGPDRRD